MQRELTLDLPTKETLVPNRPSTSSGRKTLSYKQQSQRTKRKLASKLCHSQQNEAGLLLHGISMFTRQNGDKDLTTNLDGSIGM